jgi:formylglycine-generating enzyme required for sulfatase activity
VGIPRSPVGRSVVLGDDPRYCGGMAGWLRAAAASPSLATRQRSGPYDMHGNLRAGAVGAADADRPTDEVLGPEVHEYQPVRGGGFLSPADRTRCGARAWEHPNTLGPGFRVLQVVPAGFGGDNPSRDKV